MLIDDQRLYKSPAINEQFCLWLLQLLLPWLRVLIFVLRGWVIDGTARIGPKPSDIKSQSGAYDLSAMTNLYQYVVIVIVCLTLLCKCESQILIQNSSFNKYVLYFLDLIISWLFFTPSV